MLFLFSVYINDLPNCSDSKLILYVDDSVLLRTAKCIHNLQRKKETKFRKTEKWRKINKLSLNYKKSNEMVFSHKTQDNFCITTQNATIDVRKVIKYFWVIIDFKLTWKTRMQFAAQKLCFAKEILHKNKMLCATNQFWKVYFSA